MCDDDDKWVVSWGSVWLTEPCKNLASAGREKALLGERVQRCEDCIPPPNLSTHAHLFLGGDARVFMICAAVADGGRGVSKMGE